MEAKQQQQQNHPNLSKSSDWTDVPLEVPEIIPQNGKNNNEEGAPIPPPRKKKSLKETLGSLLPYKKPIEEQLIVQKKINTKCPCCEDGFHRAKRVVEKEKEINSLKEVKRRKTPSIASLPNYTDFKLSVAGETNIDKQDLEKHSSAHSLPDESKKPNVKTNEKIDNYLTRARSFGSLLPTVLLQKMSTTKAPLAEIESDDSLGGMDDWGLNMIEHYKPRDSSLPRPRPRQKTQEEMLAEIEKQLEIEPIQEEEQKITPKIQQNIKCTPITDTVTDVKSANIVGTDEPIEHSNLMKILKEYGENHRADVQVQMSQPINDFLNAERAHFPDPIST